MWQLLKGANRGPWRRPWRLSSNGAAPLYADEGGVTVRALKSGSAALTITENEDHVLLEVEAGGPGGSPLDAWPIGSVYIAVDATSPAVRFGGGTWAAIGAGRVLVGFDGSDGDFDAAEATGGAKTVTLTEAQIPAHTHTQASHNHTQDAHTHTQNAHTHTQGAHSHTIPVGATDDTAAPFDRADAGTNTGGANATTATGSTTAVNLDATATNQNATATNQAATAVNNNTGGGEAHENMPPFLVAYFWKRTA